MNTLKFLLTNCKKLLAGSVLLSGVTAALGDDLRVGVFARDPEPILETESTGIDFPAFPERLLRTGPALSVPDFGVNGTEPRGSSIRPAFGDSRDLNSSVRPASARELRLRPRFNELPSVRPVDDFAAPSRTRFPARERSDSPASDPFIPAPVPRSLLDEESEKINELLTRRYSNPVTVRVIRSLTSAKAVELFAEVSRRIDDRSLEPTSYDIRVRRAAAKPWTCA
ncbi:MAG UNVERIFIED_CONTAM: hypothetical protein LVR18_48790 [Planctomycetaceae bacterium]|jgi:hypothetical protein